MGIRLSIFDSRLDYIFYFLHEKAMKYSFTFLSFFLALIFIFTGKLVASHTIGGDISYECLGNNQYRITLVYYRDCGSSFTTLNPTLSVSSSSCGLSLNPSLSLISGPTIITPINNRPSCSGGGVNACLEQSVYQATVTLAPCADWQMVSGLVCCRNAVQNIAGSQGLIATLNNSAASAGPNAFCNSTPQYFGASAHVVCQNTDYTLNPGVYEVDGDSLAFKLTSPRGSNGAPVGYTGAFTVNNPLPSTPALTVDVNTGEVSVRPTTQGKYGFAIEIEEWRAGVLISTTVREYQLAIVPCPVANDPPNILTPINLTGGTLWGNRIDICPGSVVSFNIPVNDPNTNDSLFITDSVSVSWGTFTSAGQGDTITGTFSGTAPSTPGNYRLVLFAKDNGCPVFSTSTYVLNLNVKNGTSILGNPVRYACSNGSNPATLTAVGGSAFNWSVVSGDATSLNGLNTSAQSIIVNPNSSTVYTVTTNFSCTAAAPTVTVNVVNPPNTVVSGEILAPNTICGIRPTPISVLPSGGSGGPFTYAWSPTNTVANATDSATMATPIDTTDYVIRVFDPASGCTAFDTVHVNVSAPYLSMNPTVSSNTYCPGDTPVVLLSNAEAGNCESYRVRSISHSPTPVNPVSGQVIALGLGSTAGPYNLGFNLDFYCNSVNQFWVSSGGWLSFSNPSGNPYTGAQQIPSTAQPNNLVSFLWGDFIVNPFGGNFLNYVITGTAPNRIGLLTMTNGLSANNNSLDNTVQVKFYEATSDIEIHITRANTGANSSIGIEGPLGQMGVAARNNAPFTISAGQEEAWRFSYDKGDPWAVNWYEQPLPGSLAGTGDTVLVTPTSPTSYCAVITDLASGCNDTICPTTTVTSANLVANGPAGPQLIGSTPTISTSYTGAAVFSCNGYQVPAIPYAPASTSGPTGLTMGDDDTQGPFNLGFTFDWYCNPVTQVWINSNGWLTFSDPGTTVPGPFSLPDNFAPDDLVSFVGSDLEPNAGGTINYQTIGTAPNRQFVVNFNNVPYYASTNTVTVQVVIDEATGLIEIHSNRIEADPFSDITQGVQLDGTTGVAAPGRNGVNLSAAITGDGIRFRPDTSNLQWRWTSDAGPGMLQDSTAANPSTVPLTSANSLICFYGELDNGACTLFDTVCIQVGALALNDFNLRSTVLDRQVQLGWDIEQNADWNRFIVEYAPQGGQFEPLGELEAGRETNFSWLHQNPDEGLNRYRLRAFDAEGSFTFSNVVEAYIGDLEEHLVSVYPNPGSGEFTLSYHLPEPAKVQLLVSDLQGKVLLQKSAIHELAGSYNQPLYLTDLMPGVYLYELRINGKTVGGKIQVQR